MAYPLHRIYKGDLYTDWPANYPKKHDSDFESDRSSQYSDSAEFTNEPKTWWVAFMFDPLDVNLTDRELLEKMLTQIKDKAMMYLSDSDEALYHSRTFAFKIITMTDTDADCLAEAELIVQDWIDNFQGLLFSRADLFRS